MGFYLEEIPIQTPFRTISRTVTESDVVLFGGITGDWNPLHFSEEVAKAGPFKTRIAHGALGLSLMFGLCNQLNLFAGTLVAVVGVENWRFLRPIFIGDTVSVQFSFVEVRATSSGTRGIVVRHTQLLNQREEVLQEGNITLMVRTKPKEAE